MGGNARAVQWQGILYPTERVVLMVDPYTGRVVGRVGPQGVAGAASTLRGFFEDLADGDREAAWLMLNPTVYNPNPVFRYPKTYRDFMSETRTPGSPVRTITDIHWMLPGPGFPYESCGCRLFGGGPHTPGGFVRVAGSLVNGHRFDTVVIRGPNGTWSLLWDWAQHSLIRE